MPLPTLSVPTFEVDLPSTGKKIKYRPFLVKEEKLLLLAMEGENEQEVETAVKDILKACILTRGVKVENLASFDLEYLFLRIRSVSSGEEIKMKVTCQDDGTTEVNVSINIDDIQVQKPEGHTNKIMFEDDIGIIMKYPGVDQFINITLLNKDLNSASDVFELVAKCVDQIFQGEEVWEASDMKLEEIITFLEGMTQPQFEKIQNFFETMPVLSHTLEVTNPNTGNVSVYHLEGLQSFFA